MVGVFDVILHIKSIISKESYLIEYDNRDDTEILGK